MNDQEKAAYLLSMELMKETKMSFWRNPQGTLPPKDVFRDLLVDLERTLRQRNWL